MTSNPISTVCIPIPANTATLLEVVNDVLIVLTAPITYEVPSQDVS
jgi:hypothetical protein